MMSTRAGTLSFVVAVSLGLVACGVREPAAFDQDKAERGAKIHERLAASYPDSRISVWGTANPSVSACIWIAEDEWAALSPGEREELTEFLASQIPTIRANPDRYVGIPTSAPIYSKLRANIVGMGDRSLTIFTMTKSNGQWVQKQAVVKE